MSLSITEEEPPRTDVAAQALVAVVDADAHDALAAVPGSILRDAAVAAALLVREAALLASIVTPDDRRRDEAGSRAVRLLGRLCDAAYAGEDHQLSQLLDWFARAWLGRPFNGAIYGDRHLPEAVHAPLAALTEQAGEAPVMICAAAHRELERVLAELERDASRLSAIDREVTGPLFVRPVREVIEAARAGQPHDAGLLAERPEDLVAAVNRTLREPIPTNGRRWPLLVRATEQIQDHVRRSIELGRLAQGAVAPPAVPGDTLPAPLDELVAVALTAAEPPPVGERLPETLARAALAHAGTPELGCRVAGVLEGLDIATAEVEEALSPLQDLHERVLEYAARCPDDAEVEEVAALIGAGIADCDLGYARDGLDLLAVTVRGAELRRRLTRTGNRIEAMPPDLAGGAGPHLRAARIAVAEQRFEDAEFHLTEIDGLTGPRPRTGPTPRPPAAPATPSLADFKRRRDGSDVPTLSAIEQAVADGDRDELLALARRLGRPDTVELVDAMIDRFATDGEVAEALLSGLPPRQRPAVLHRLAEVRRARGDEAGAEEAARRSRPPVPPAELTVASPLPAADLLVPRINSSTGADDARPSATELADALADETRAGSAISLGWAVGQYVFAGDPLRGLELYRECAERFYGNATLAWNLGCAYAAVGCRDEAVGALRYFLDIMADRVPAEQRAALTEFLRHNGVPAPEPTPPPVPVALPQHVMQAQEKAAKALYEQGQAEAALRRIRRLLRLAPHSPGAFLLLRICREQRWLDQAREAVAEIAAAGAANWRHHYELARIAVEVDAADLAEEHLRTAADLGASMDELYRLRQRIGAGGPVAGARLDGAAEPATGASALPPLPQPRDLVREVRAAIADPYDPSHLVGLARQALMVMPSAATVIVDEVLAAPHADELVGELVRFLPAEGQLTAVLVLAPELGRAGRTRDAIDLLRGVETVARPTELPRVWLTLQRLMRDAGIDPDGEPGGWLRLPATPGPPRSDGPALAPPPWITEIAVTSGTPPAVHRAHQVQLEQGPAAAAQLWRDAVAAGFGLALPNALGTLVLTGRAAEAVALYRQTSDRLYLVASAAWNLGCAFAYLGDLESAGAAFEYHTRVTSRTYLPEQRAALERLFAELGRPLPMPVAHPGWRPVPSPRSAPAGGVSAARAVEAFRRAPDAHRFIVASSALRAEMADAPPDRRRLLLAQIEEMFAELPSPTAHPYAEHIRALALAGEDQRAWTMVLDCLDRFDLAAELLAPALALATGRARVTQLEEILTRQADGGDYTRYLTLAKLARKRGDGPARRRYAEAALLHNPSSAEARKLLGRGAPPAENRPIWERRSALEDLVRSMTTREPVEVLKQLPDYSAEIKRLESRAVDVLTPYPPCDEFLDIEDEARPAVDAGIRAARHEDWPLAATEFGAALQLQPRHLGVARNTAGAFIRLGRLSDARAIAESISYSHHGRLLLAQLAYAEKDLDRAADHLAELSVAGVPEANAYAFGLAGLRLHLQNRPREAAEALLRRAEDALPGRPEFSTAMAAVIADSHGHDDLVRRAVGLLFTPRLTSRQAVDWAIERQRLEALGAPHAPELRPADLERLVDHFAGQDPVRLRNFLDRLADRLPAARNREVRLLRARVAEECGLIEDAFAARFGLLDPNARDRRAMLDDLTAFCERTLYLEGLDRVLEVKREWQLLTPVDSDRAEAQRSSIEYRRSVYREKINATLWEIQRIRTDDDIARVEPPLAALTDRLLGFTEGTGVAQAVHRLAGLWRRCVELLPQVGGPVTDVGLRSELLTVLRQIRSLQTGLGSPVVEEAAATVGKWLYGRWEQIARDQRSSTGAIEVNVLAATRIVGGPVEAVVEFTAHVEVRELRVRLGGQTTNLGRMDAEEQRTEGFCADVAADDVSLTVTFQTADGLRDEIVRQLALEVGDQHEHPVRSLFTPNVTATGDMFFGRNAELEKLRLEYGEAHTRNATIRSLTGPRKVGKTSLLQWLETDGPPESWKIPYVLPIYLDVSSFPSGAHPLGRIGRAIASAAEALAAQGRFTDPVPPPPAEPDDAQAFIRWCRRLRAACAERLGFLVILDEVQELLKDLHARQELGPVAASLRTIANSGAVALLLCGSCTGATLKALLAGTALQDELQTETLGYLDRRATEQVFEEGFAGTARILPEARAEVWRLTEGHPNHIHHIGKDVALRLTTDRRRLVTRSLVGEVGLAMAKTSAATIGIVKLDTEGPDGRDLLVQLANRAQGAIDLGETAELKRELDARHMDQIDRYLLIGLLRVDREQYRWANEIINLHVQHFAERQFSQLRFTIEESHLHASQYETQRTYSLGPCRTRLVMREGQLFTAKRVTHTTDTGGRSRADSSALTGDETAKLVDEFLTYLSRTPLTGVPRYVGREGDWFLFDHAEGRSLAEIARMQRDVPTEPYKLVRWIAAACDVVERVFRLRGITHGNIKPGNVIVDDTTVSVVDWGRGTQDGSANPISGGTPGYLSPGYLRRLDQDEGGALPTDDVFALGVVLYQMLDPNGELPYGTELADLDTAGRPAGARPLPVELPLMACLTRAIALRDEDRYVTAGDFARDLRLAVPEAAPERPAEFPPAPAPPRTAGQSLIIHRVEEMNVTKDGISIEGSSVTGSVVGNRNRIGTFAVNAGVETSELTARIAQLESAVEALRAELPAGVADGVARDLAAFTGEATAEAPRPDRLQRIGADIVDAAETVPASTPLFQRVGLPVITLVNEIINMIAG
ncbi:AAA ATPase domain-containing protein [Micromonospora echinaurantiaca]|uniref:non-specific serine/threonine protein kinase n=1 Tax=Micromonospora echinaurantiaca TaxID=47857 RepID=A0A1C5HLX5_9ACTN|nr:AAA ATPase domain-containing protein [Micromonospora echinaurantiaca]